MQRSIKEEIKYLEGKLSKNENSMLFARLADAYLQMDRVDEAIALCEKGIKKHPYYVTGHYVLGKCYFRKKLFDQAEKELKRVLLFDPKYLAAHRDYAELMAQIGWINTSEMSYQEIVRIDPLNQAAKQRLEELRSRMDRAPERPTAADEKELQAVEADLISELEAESEADLSKTAASKSDRQVDASHSTDRSFMPELDVAPETENEFGPESPHGVVPDVPSAAQAAPREIPTPPQTRESRRHPGQQAYFSENEPLFEDDNANLDLLEDIFRDDELSDLLGEEDDLVSQIEQPDFDALDTAPDEAGLGDQFSKRSEFEDHGDFETSEMDGLADEDVFALMTGDEDRISPAPPSRESHEPSWRRETPSKPEPKAKRAESEAKPQPKADVESPLKKTLETIQRQTRPRFEPPSEAPRATEQQTADSDSSEPSDKNDLLRKKEKIVTPTLGEIYAAQHQYAKAIGVYEILRKKDPNNEFYKQKIEYLQKKLEESQSES